MLLNKIFGNQCHVICFSLIMLQSICYFFLILSGAVNTSTQNFWCTSIQFFLGSSNGSFFSSLPFVGTFSVCAVCLSLQSVIFWLSLIFVHIFSLLDSACLMVSYFWVFCEHLCFFWSLSFFIWPFFALQQFKSHFVQLIWSMVFSFFC